MPAYIVLFTQMSLFYASLHCIVYPNVSFLCQLTYSMTRFAVYDMGKKNLTKNGREMPFYEKVLLAGSAGAMGGFVGTPADLVNVRQVLVQISMHL